MHIHITCPDGEAKFWLEPLVTLDCYWGLDTKQIKECQKIIEEHKHEIAKSWKKHFQN